MQGQWARRTRQHREITKITDQAIGHSRRLFQSVLFALPAIDHILLPMHLVHNELGLLRPHTEHELVWWQRLFEFGKFWLCFVVHSLNSPRKSFFKTLNNRDCIQCGDKWCYDELSNVQNTSCNCTCSFCMPAWSYRCETAKPRPKADCTHRSIEHGQLIQSLWPGRPGDAENA